MSADNIPLAFPHAERYGDQGMTLRDYFAAKAMQPILQGAVLPTQADLDKYLPMAADVAYQMADAMLKERAK